MALRAAICCWLDAASEARKMKRAMKRMMNRALAGAYTTWAADIMGQRDIGAKLRSADAGLLPVHQLVGDGKSAGRAA